MHGDFGRPRLRARLLAASSYLGLVLMTAQPSQVRAQEYRGRPPFEGFYNHGFLSVEGGLLFNGSQRNLSFAPDDQFFGGLNALRPGHRIGSTAGIAFGWMVDPSWDWAVRFRHNNFGTSEETSPTAFARSRLHYETIDGEVGFYVPMWRPANVRVFAGPRVLHSSNQISYGYNTLTVDPIGGPFDKLGQYQHDVSLWGFGPRAGLEASLPLGDLPLTFNASGSGSVLFSRVDHRYDFSFTNENFPIGESGSGSTHLRSSRTIYNLEGNVSIVYHIAPPVAVHLGYQAAQYWSLNTSILNPNFRGPFQTGRGNVLSHGPFVRFVFDLP